MWTRLEKAIAVVGSAAISALGLFAITRRSSRAFGDSDWPDDDVQAHVLNVAKDAFLTDDVKRAEKILEELPIEQRTIARCTKASNKRYGKGDRQKGWIQRSRYQLYRPFVADPKHGQEPLQYPYTDVTVVTQKSISTNDGTVTNWIDILGELAPTIRHPQGTQRFLVSGQQERASQTAALRRLGYNIVIPCSNVPLSGRRTRRRR